MKKDSPTYDKPCAECGHHGSDHKGYSMPCKLRGCKCMRYVQDKWATDDVSFICAWPCPRCEQARVMGFYYLTENGSHQHTYFVCTYWPSFGERCGWGDWRGDRGDINPDVKLGV